MRERAILITGLIKNIVYRMDFARYYSVQNLKPFVATDGQALISPELDITERVVPITQFCRPGKPDLYIAYSEEVEELLGVPIRTLLREKDEAYSELQRFRSLTMRQHLKAAWRAFMNLQL